MPCACNGSTPVQEDRTWKAKAPNGEEFAGLTEHEAKVKATMTGGTYSRM